MRRLFVKPEARASATQPALICSGCGRKRFVLALLQSEPEPWRAVRESYVFRCMVQDYNRRAFHPEDFAYTCERCATIAASDQRERVWPTGNALRRENRKPIGSARCQTRSP
jgi:hypothetical protein